MEIKRKPISDTDDAGNPTVTFDSEHTVADIVRWIQSADWCDDFLTLMEMDAGENNPCAVTFYSCNE